MSEHICYMCVGGDRCRYCFDYKLFLHDDKYEIIISLQQQLTTAQEEIVRLRVALGKIRIVCKEEANWNADANALGLKIWCIAEKSLSTPPSSAIGELVDAVSDYMNDTCDDCPYCRRNNYKCIRLQQAYTKVIGKGVER